MPAEAVMTSISACPTVLRPHSAANSEDSHHSSPTPGPGAPPPAQPHFKRQRAIAAASVASRSKATPAAAAAAPVPSQTQHEDDLMSASSGSQASGDHLLAGHPRVVTDEEDASRAGDSHAYAAGAFFVVYSRFQLVQIVPPHLPL